MREQQKITAAAVAANAVIEIAYLQSLYQHHGAESVTCRKPEYTSELKSRNTNTEQQLGKDAASSPDVNTSCVVPGTKQQLRSTVPSEFLDQLT